MCGWNVATDTDKLHRPRKILRLSRSPTPDSDLASDLRSSLLQGGSDEAGLADTVLRSGVDGERVPAVRVLLSARSCFFKSLLYSGDLGDGLPPEVQVPGMDGATLRAVVEFCYTDDTALFRRCLTACRGEAKNSEDALVPEVTALVRLAKAGDYFAIPKLTRKACFVAKGLLSHRPSAACALLKELGGVSLNIEELQKTASFVLRSIWQNVESTLLAGSNVKLLSAFTLKEILLGIRTYNVAAQQAAFQALVVWLQHAVDKANDSARLSGEKHDPASSSSCESEIFSQAREMAKLCFRLEQLPPKFLIEVVSPSQLISQETIAVTLGKQALAAQEIHGVDFSAPRFAGSHRWKIRSLSSNMSVAPHSQPNTLWSQEFEIGDFQWQLGVMTGRWEQHGRQNGMNLMLYAAHDPISPEAKWRMHVESFSLRIVNVNPTLTWECRVEDHLFHSENPYFVVAIDWPTLAAIRADGGSGFLPNDTMSVELEIHGDAQWGNEFTCWELDRACSKYMQC